MTKKQFVKARARKVKQLKASIKSADVMLGIIEEAAREFRKHRLIATSQLRRVLVSDYTSLPEILQYPERYRGGGF